MMNPYIKLKMNNSKLFFMNLTSYKTFRSNKKMDFFSISYNRIFPVLSNNESIQRYSIFYRT